jgi:hypothetical protein
MKSVERSKTFADELVDVVKHEERERYKKHAHKHRLIILHSLSL